MTKARRPLLRSGLVLGFGLGGFFDGIVLHQIFQLHHLTSSIYPMDTVAGLELNTFWDGIFHAAMYAITLIGLVLLWRALHRRGVPFAPRIVIGAIAVGFGIFHLFDSIINHWLLNLHHICYGPNLMACDVGFFVIGVLLIIAGAVTLRAATVT
ncbi:MAG: DUF2243 domain-containing protein [Chloroflexota bacterium]|nr:DUF2243 domain-containing protein [Chloroflexota bacterium]